METTLTLVKNIKTMTGLGLKEAKTIIDMCRESGVTSINVDNQKEQVIDLKRKFRNRIQVHQDKIARHENDIKLIEAEITREQNQIAEIHACFQLNKE
jgi:DNA-binding transcriptional MerR regulator